MLQKEVSHLEKGQKQSPVKKVRTMMARYKGFSETSSADCEEMKKSLAERREKLEETLSLLTSISESRFPNLALEKRSQLRTIAHGMVLDLTPEAFRNNDGFVRDHIYAVEWEQKEIEARLRDDEEFVNDALKKLSFTEKNLLVGFRMKIVSAVATVVAGVGGALCGYLSDNPHVTPNVAAALVGILFAPVGCVGSLIVYRNSIPDMQKASSIASTLDEQFGEEISEKERKQNDLMEQCRTVLEETAPIIDDLYTYLKKHNPVSNTEE